VSKVFIDTNILIYSIDFSDPVKQKKARELLARSVLQDKPVISTQVINEFYVVATKKLNADPVIIKNIIHNYSNMEIVQTDLQLIESAIDISIISCISYWDSLIIAAADKALCECIFSEDLNPGQNYRGVVVKNPFA